MTMKRLKKNKHRAMGRRAKGSKGPMSVEQKLANKVKREADRERTKKLQKKKPATA